MSTPHKLSPKKPMTASPTALPTKPPKAAARDAAVRAMRLPLATYKSLYDAIHIKWTLKYCSTATATTPSQQVAVTLLVLRLVAAFQKQQQQVGSGNSNDGDNNNNNNNNNNNDETTPIAPSKKLAVHQTAVAELVDLASDLVAAVPAFAAAHQHAVAAAAAAATGPQSPGKAAAATAKAAPGTPTSTTTTTTATALFTTSTSTSTNNTPATLQGFTVASVAALLYTAIFKAESESSESSSSSSSNMNDDDNDEQDAAVAQVALYSLVQDLFAATVGDNKNTNTTTNGDKNADTNTTNTMNAFMAFACAACRTLPCFVTAEMSAWQDFLYVHRSAWQDGGLQATIHETIQAVAVNLEPFVPGLPEEKDNDNDDEKDNGDDEPMKNAAQDAAKDDGVARVQSVCWKLACLAGKKAEDRRSRLLASCAASALITILPILSGDTSKLTAGDDNDDGEDGADKEPARKKTKTDKKEQVKKNALQVILNAANEEAAFTRWACLSGYTKVASDLTLHELGMAVGDLAKELLTALTMELGKANPALTQFPGKEVTPVANLSPFLETLSHLMGDANGAKKLTWYLPSLVDSLNSTHLQAVKDEDSLAMPDVPMVDRVGLVSMQDKLELFCGVSNKPQQQLTKLGSPSIAVAAVAGSPDAKTPARVEKQIKATLTEAASPPKGGVQSPGQILRRAVTPPIITEGMELNEWTVSVLYLDVVKPSRKLLAFLQASGDGDQEWHEVMMPVLNRTLLRLSQENMADKPTRIAPVSVGMEPEGQVNIHGDMTPNKQLCKAVVALYYHALEAVLFCETTRLSVSAHPRIVANDVFHKALLACCCSVVVKAVGATQKVRPSANLQTLQIYSILHVTESNPYDCLKVSESFFRALTLNTARGNLGSPLIFALPRILQREVKLTEVQIMDSLLWARDPKFTDSMPDKIEDFEEKSEVVKGKESVCLWPPHVLAPNLREEIEDLDGEVPRSDFPTAEHEDVAEYRCFTYLLRKLLRLAYTRIQALCKVLDVPHNLPVATQVWVAFRYLLRHNVEVLYDRHVDHWILCSLYGVAKTLKLTPVITFARIIEAYVSVRGQELGDVTCQRIVRHIKISTGGNENATIGNVIVLYNKVFVPAMKDHLLKSKSLKRSILEVVAAQSKPVEPKAVEGGNTAVKATA